MKRTLARSLPLIALAIVVSAQSSAATQKKKALPKAPTTAPAPAKSKAESIEPKVGEKIMTALLSKIASPPRVQLRINMGNDGGMNELKARTEIPFSGGVVVPLASSNSANPQVAKLIPNAVLKTAGIVVRWNANTDSKGNTISNEITFHNAKGNPVPLIVAIESPLTDLLEFRIESVKVDLEGLKKGSAAIDIKASCDLQQSLVDLTTGKGGWEDATCEFKGKYVREPKAGQEKFTFRFTYDSF